MKANELRIGNWVKVFGKYDKLSGIAVNDYVAENYGHSISDDSITSIPLTEEILLKGGYAANKYHDEFTKGDITLDCEYTDGGVFNALYKDTYIKEIKFLHELQNLEYTLTNTELEINDL
jgi:hypothetical protein